MTTTIADPKATLREAEIAAGLAGIDLRKLDLPDALFLFGRGVDLTISLAPGFDSDRILADFAAWRTQLNASEPLRTEPESGGYTLVSYGHHNGIPVELRANVFVAKEAAK